MAYVADLVLRKISYRSLDDIQDSHLLQLVEGLNFGKLYGRTLFNLGTGQQQFKTNEGEWLVYTQGTNHLPLVKSLEGKNTGWCTAGESTAKSQLEKGDFHVYYSFDSNKKPTIPRVAIRMENDQIAEVRGVGKDQNLDDKISQDPIIKNKLFEFGDKGGQFLKKDADMKMVTEISKKHKLKIALSKADLIFLYEFESKIDGFGFQKDPRISEVLKYRDFKKDLVFIYDNQFKRDEISLSKEEFLSKNGKIKFHLGNLNLSNLKSGIGLKLPEVIIGNLDLSNLRSAEGIQFPKKINGTLFLTRLSSAAGLKLSDTINGDLYMFSLKSVEGLILPKILNGHIIFHSLKSVVGLKLPAGATLQSGFADPHSHFMNENFKQV